MRVSAVPAIVLVVCELYCAGFHRITIFFLNQMTVIVHYNKSIAITILLLLGCYMYDRCHRSSFPLMFDKTFAELISVPSSFNKAFAELISVPSSLTALCLL